jgi:hypothetical protein
MDCKELQKKFIPFIDDKLSISELDEFLHHVNQCQECREEYDIYYTMIMGMRYLEESQDISVFKLDSEQKLKSASDYLIKYRILRVQKYILFIVLCLCAVFLM